MSEDEGGIPLTEKIRFLFSFYTKSFILIVWKSIKRHYLKLQTFITFRKNGLSLAETASKSLTSLISLKEKVSPRLFYPKVK